MDFLCVQFQFTTKHFIFLLLNTFCTATLLGAVADLKKQRVLIRILIMEERLKDLKNG